MRKRWTCLTKREETVQFITSFKKFSHHRTTLRATMRNLIVYRRGQMSITGYKQYMVRSGEGRRLQ